MGTTEENYVKWCPTVLKGYKLDQITFPKSVSQESIKIKKTSCITYLMTYSSHFNQNPKKSLIRRVNRNKAPFSPRDL